MPKPLMSVGRSCSRVLENPDVGANRRIRLAHREGKALLVETLEKRQRDDRIVDRANDVADVVPRAFVGDLPRLLKGRRCLLQEEFGQPSFPVAYDRAVDFVDVAERKPVCGIRRLDQKKVGPQRPPLGGRDIRARATPAELARTDGGNGLLAILLLRHDVPEMLDEEVDVGGRSVQSGVERNRLGACRLRLADHHDDADEAGEERTQHSQHYTAVPWMRHARSKI